MFCVSISFVQKPRQKTDGFFKLQAFSGSYAKKEENISLLLLLATSCFQPWEQNLSIKENIKTVFKSISETNFFTGPGLESEI